MEIVTYSQVIVLFSYLLQVNCQPFSQYGPIPSYTSWWNTNYSPIIRQPSQNWYNWPVNNGAQTSYNTQANIKAVKTYWDYMKDAGFVGNLWNNNVGNGKNIYQSSKKPQDPPKLSLSQKPQSSLATNSKPSLPLPQNIPMPNAYPSIPQTNQKQNPKPLNSQRPNLIPQKEAENKGNQKSQQENEHKQENTDKPVNRPEIKKPEVTKPSESTSTTPVAANTPSLTPTIPQTSPSRPDSAPASDPIALSPKIENKEDTNSEATPNTQNTNPGKPNSSVTTPSLPSTTTNGINTPTNPAGSTLSPNLEIPRRSEAPSPVTPELNTVPSSSNELNAEKQPQKPSSSPQPNLPNQQQSPPSPVVDESVQRHNALPTTPEEVPLEESKSGSATPHIPISADMVSPQEQPSTTSTGTPSPQLNAPSVQTPQESPNIVSNAPPISNITPQPNPPPLNPTVMQTIPQQEALVGSEAASVTPPRQSSTDVTSPEVLRPSQEQPSTTSTGAPSPQLNAPSVQAPQESPNIVSNAPPISNITPQPNPTPLNPTVMQTIPQQETLAGSEAGSITPPRQSSTDMTSPEVSRPSQEQPTVASAGTPLSQPTTPSIQQQQTPSNTATNSSSSPTSSITPQNNQASTNTVQGEQSQQQPVVTPGRQNQPTTPLNNQQPPSRLSQAVQNQLQQAGRPRNNV